MLRTLRPLVTLTLNHTRIPAMSVHDVAAKGFAEGTNDLYDRARPSYPPAAVKHIASLLPSSPPTIIEPGAGTGIFTRLLISPPNGYPSLNIKELVAVEPSKGMRDTWAKTCGPPAKAVEGGFDDFSKAGLSEGSADAVVIAQAWHWCPDHEAALTEIAKYLKKGAPLVLIWNLESNKDPWHAGLREIYQPLDQGSPQYYRGLWRKMFDAKAIALFEDVEESHYEWAMEMNEDTVVERVYSKSYMTEEFLNGEKRKDVEIKLREVIRSGDKEWVDKDKGTFKYKYTTDVYVFRKK